MLEEARTTNLACTDFRLSETIRTQLRQIRCELQEQFAPSLTTLLATKDPVFSVCIANQLQPDVPNHFWQKAYECYSTKAEDYKSILGRLIPDDFKHWAESMMETEAYRKGTNPSALQDFNTFLIDLNNEQQYETVGIPCRSDLATLDSSILKLEGLSFIAGKKGVGKTTLQLSVAHQLLRADRDLSILFYTLELSKHQLMARLVSRESGLDYRSLKSRSHACEDESRFEAATQSMNEYLSRIRFVERPQVTEGTWKRFLNGYVRRLQEASSTNKSVVFIDNFQRMEVPAKIHTSSEDDDGYRLSTDSAKDDYRLDAIQQFRSDNRTAWQPNGPPVILTSEIVKYESSNRSKSMRELTVDDMKGSSRLASEAENILLLWPPKEEFNGADSVDLKLRIAKGRDGVIRRDIDLTFHHTLSRFTERPEKKVHSSPKSRTTKKAAKIADAPTVNPLADA